MNKQNHAHDEFEPAARSGGPQRIVADASMTNAEKIKLLLDWRQDLVELQNASSENMPDQTGDTNVGERLKAVTDALIALGHESS